MTSSVQNDGATVASDHVSVDVKYRSALVLEYDFLSDSTRDPASNAHVSDVEEREKGLK